MAKADIDKLKGAFSGPLIVKIDDDERSMTLQKPFGYVGVDKAQWLVPKGAKTDGASIPRALWALLGSPFAGKYRRAAVVHDWYCDVRSRPWQAVHRMFFEAMLTADVSERQARILYAGVLFGGPRWNAQAIHNTELSLRARLARRMSPRGARLVRLLVAPSTELSFTLAALPSPELSEERLGQLVELIDDGDLRTDHMEALVERARKQALA